MAAQERSTTEILSRPTSAWRLSANAGTLPAKGVVLGTNPINSQEWLELSFGRYYRMAHTRIGTMGQDLPREAAVALLARWSRQARGER
jgi:hypothetical protein